MGVNIHAPSAAAENLTKTNDILCPTDRAAYQQELFAVNTRLAVIRREIAEASEKIRILQEDEGRLTSYAHTYKKLLHPIRDLPEEILREIFFSCIDTFDVMAPLGSQVDFASPCLDTTQPPWSLAQVCRRWRQITLHFPSLWTFVRIYITDFRPSQSGMVNLLSTYLRRSGTLPLIIQITSQRPSPTHPLFLALHAHCFRWAEVHFRFKFGDNWEIFHGMSSTIKADVPILHTIHLSLMGGILLENLVIDAFEFAPRLQHVVIRQSIQGEGTGITLKVPWNQLKTFQRVYFYHEGTTSDTFPQTSPLNLTHYCDHVDSCESGPEVHLPDLQSLVLLQPLARDRSQNSSTTVLDRIRPSVKFCNLALTPWLSLQSIESFLARSGRTIRTLRFADSRSADIGRLLDYVPAVTNLIVECPSQALMECLAEKDASGNPRVLPQLQALVMFITPTFDEETWVKLLSARVATSGDSKAPTAFTLQHLCTTGNSLSGQMRLGMEQFIKQGLRVDFLPDSAHYWHGLMVTL